MLDTLQADIAVWSYVVGVDRHFHGFWSWTAVFRKHLITALYLKSTITDAGEYRLFLGEPPAHLHNPPVFFNTLHPAPDDHPQGDTPYPFRMIG